MPGEKKPTTGLGFVGLGMIIGGVVVMQAFPWLFGGVTHDEGTVFGINLAGGIAGVLVGVPLGGAMGWGLQKLISKSSE